MLPENPRNRPDLVEILAYPLLKKVIFESVSGLYEDTTEEYLELKDILQKIDENIKIRLSFGKLRNIVPFLQNHPTSPTECRRVEKPLRMKFGEI